jgi:hypothetical protein
MFEVLGVLCLIAAVGSFVTDRGGGAQAACLGAEAKA